MYFLYENFYVFVAICIHIAVLYCFSALNVQQNKKHFKRDFIVGCVKTFVLHTTNTEYNLWSVLHTADSRKTGPTRFSGSLLFRENFRNHLNHTKKIDFNDVNWFYCMKIQEKQKSSANELDFFEKYDVNDVPFLWFQLMILYVERGDPTYMIWNSIVFTRWYWVVMPSIAFEYNTDGCSSAISMSA